MLVELRQYRTRPGQRENWVRYMEQEIVPFQRSKGMTILGTWVAEQEDDLFVWLRQFDSEEERVRLTPRCTRVTSGNRASLLASPKCWTATGRDRTPALNLRELPSVDALFQAIFVQDENATVLPTMRPSFVIWRRNLLSVSRVVSAYSARLVCVVGGVHRAAVWLQRRQPQKHAGQSGGHVQKGCVLDESRVAAKFAAHIGRDRSPPEGDRARRPESRLG